MIRGSLNMSHKIIGSPAAARLRVLVDARAREPEYFVANVWRSSKKQYSRSPWRSSLPFSSQEPLDFLHGASKYHKGAI